MVPEQTTMSKPYRYRGMVLGMCLVLILSYLESSAMRYPSEKNTYRDNGRDKSNTLHASSISIEWYRTWGGGDEDWSPDEMEYLTETIAIDSSDNVYVVGTTESFGRGDSDICILKYDNSGTQLWNSTWGGLNSEYGKSIIIDDVDDVYLVGITQSWGSGDGNVCVLKYNTLGELLWNYTWGSVLYSDSAEEVCETRMGLNDTLYIAGSIRGSVDGNRDFFVIKMSSQGMVLWNRTWGLVHADEWCYDLQVDTLGNLYLTGHVSNEDAIVVKFTSSGDEIWNRTWGGMGEERVRTSVLDSENNIYITGTTTSFGLAGDLFLLKYNPQGELLWERVWGTDHMDEAPNLYAGKTGDIFLSGSTNFVSFLVRYNKYGEVIWNYTRQNSGSTKGSLMIKSYSSMYLFTTIWNDSQDFAIATFNSNGIICFDSTWGGSQDESISGVCIDSSDSIYIVGNTQSFGMGNTDIFVVKYKNPFILSNLKDQTQHTRNTGERSIPAGMNILVTGFLGISFLAVTLYLIRKRSILSPKK